MKTETTKTDTGHCTIGIKPTGSGENYFCYCNCVTGVFGGYNKTAVINHAKKYSTRSNSTRAFKTNLEG